MFQCPWCKIKVFILEAKCAVTGLQSLGDAVSFWKEKGSAFNRLWAAELIMWILMQTEERQRACEQFSSLSPSQRVSLFPLPKKSSFPSPPQVYHATSCPSTSPPLNPPPPSFSPAKNERHSIYSLSLHLLAVVFLPPPNASNFPHLLCSWILSLLHFTILSAYSTQSEWTHSWPCISVQPVSS